MMVTAIEARSLSKALALQHLSRPQNKPLISYLTISPSKQVCQQINIKEDLLVSFVLCFGGSVTEPC
jgi:hypothetical protein